MTAIITIATTTVTLILYFTNDMTKLNDRIGTTFPNEPSWVFEIEAVGTDSREILKKLSTKYNNLLEVVDKITGQHELVDSRVGDPTQYQDVSPFLAYLIEKLGYTPDPGNPPPNTGSYKEGDVLKWITTK